MLRNALRIHQDQFRCAKLSVGGQIFIWKIKVRGQNWIFLSKWMFFLFTYLFLQPI